MKNIIRIGMFETNSSSMHSIVIKKVKEVPYGEENYNDFLGNYLGNRINNRRVWFKDFEDENYCRQGGRILISTEDKLNLYLTLLAKDILYGDGYFPKMDCSTFREKFETKITELNENFFNKLGTNLTVELPEMSDEYKDGSYYANLPLPYMEDSDGIFDILMKKLEDPKNLYSYLYLPESFVFLAGDEYDSAHYLKEIIQKGMSYQEKDIIGCLKEKD